MEHWHLYLVEKKINNKCIQQCVTPNSKCDCISIVLLKIYTFNQMKMLLFYDNQTTNSTFADKNEACNKY